MTFRFRRRIRLFPGVYANISKRGVSVSAGVRGARVTLDKRGGVRETVSLPGTGASWNEYHRPQTAPAGTPRQRQRRPVRHACLILAAILAGLLALALVAG
jgi:hypothetical protein